MTGTTASPPRRKRADSLAAKGGAWVAAGAAVATLAGVASNAILARVLQPGDLGAYLLLFAVVTAFATVGRVGLDLAGIRLVAEARSRNPGVFPRTTLTRVLTIATVSSVALGCLLASAGFPFLARRVFHNPAVVLVGIPAGLWVTAEALRFVVSELYRGFADHTRATLFGNATRNVLAVTTFGLLACITREVSLALVVWVTVAVSGAVLFAGLIPLLRRRQRAPNRRNPPPSAARELYPPRYRKILAVGLPVMFSVLAMQGLLQGDLWIIGSVHAGSDVALYGAAARTVGLLALPLTVLNAFVAPIAITLLASEQRDHLSKIVRAATTAAAAPVLAVIVALSLFGSHILGLLYGPFYRDAWPILVILAFGQLVNVGLGPCGTILMMTGSERFVMTVTGITAAVTLVAEAVVSPRWGLTGVAACAATGLTALNGVLLVACRRCVGIWTGAFLSPRRLRASLHDVRLSGSR